MYVQNTKDIIIYNATTKVSKLIGTVGDPILALDVQDKQSREDLEEAKEVNFIVSVVDDGEVISVFDTENDSPKPKAVVS